MKNSDLLSLLANGFEPKTALPLQDTRKRGLDLSTEKSFASDHTLPCKVFVSKFCSTVSSWTIRKNPQGETDFFCKKFKHSKRGATVLTSLKTSDASEMFSVPFLLTDITMRMHDTYAGYVEARSKLMN